LGCNAQRPWGRCAVLGGAAGAVLVGGASAGLADTAGPANDNRSDEVGIAGAIGAATGAIIGAIVGHYACDPVLPQAPPPPPPPPRHRRPLTLLRRRRQRKSWSFAAYISTSTSTTSVRATRRCWMKPQRL